MNSNIEVQNFKIDSMTHKLDNMVSYSYLNKTAKTYR